MRIPGYEILKLLGRGGMGEVYLARQVALERLVAIKCLQVEGIANLDARLARFRREAELMARASHPNVLSIFDFGMTAEWLYLVMEYVEGGDLRRLMAPGVPMSTLQVRAILPPIAEALEHLHHLGILHRDLKPENILMHHGDNPKVADFGIAVLRAGSGALTRTSEGLGTDGYVAPEQRYRLRVDERADQYSLAALTYELLTAERPLGIIRPPSRLNPRLNTRLDAVLLKALKEDPQDRYASIRDFVRDLEQSFVKSPASRWPAQLCYPAAALGLVVLALVAAWPRGIEQHLDAEPQPPERPPVTATSDRPVPLDRIGTNRLEPERIVHNSLGMRLLLIPAGEFWMGAYDADEDARPDESPRRRIRITRPFYLGACEVTVAQFRRFVEATGYRTDAERLGNGSAWSTERQEVVIDPQYTWRTPGYPQPQQDDEPVVQVSRSDALEFCQWLSNREGRLSAYRLPTEAEWEYACRAGTTTKWSMGDDPKNLEDHAWYRANSYGRLQPVGGKQPNRFGLFDMHGNASEICMDWYDSYPEHDVTDPQGPLQGGRWVHRGGSWGHANNLVWTRSSARDFAWRPYFTIGFRILRSVD